MKSLMAKKKSVKLPYAIEEASGSYTKVVYPDGKWFLADARLLKVLSDYLKLLLRKK